MKPSRVVFILRQIAAAIDKSRKPRRDLVLQDLRRIAAIMEEEEEEEEERPCDGCGQMTPVLDLSGFGPEGDLCSDCQMRAERRYRGKPMGWGV